MISVGSETASHTGNILILERVPQIVEAVAALPALAAGGVFPPSDLVWELGRAPDVLFMPPQSMLMRDARVRFGNFEVV